MNAAPHRVLCRVVRVWGVHPLLEHLCRVSVELIKSQEVDRPDDDALGQVAKVVTGLVRLDAAELLGDVLFLMIFIKKC